MTCLEPHSWEWGSGNDPLIRLLTTGTQRMSCPRLSSPCWTAPPHLYTPPENLSSSPPATGIASGMPKHHPLSPPLGSVRSSPSMQVFPPVTGSPPYPASASLVRGSPRHFLGAPGVPPVGTHSTKVMPLSQTPLQMLVH